MYLLISPVLKKLFWTIQEYKKLLERRQSDGETETQVWKHFHEKYQDKLFITFFRGGQSK